MTATDDLALHLSWHHGRGALGPFFSALEQGRIMGARCTACGRTVVPFRTRCTVDGAQMAPLDLPVTGIVRQVTVGSASGLLPGGLGGRTFGLIEVTGADTSLLARIADGEGPVAEGTPVRLAPAEAGVTHPSQWLVFVADT